MYSFLTEQIDRYEDTCETDNEFMDELDFDFDFFPIDDEEDEIDEDFDHELICGITCFQCYDEELETDPLPF